ncbi:cellulase family glycosylhydrolase [Candidatus Bipolaricaulota bacterium]|nr:cellulase family glycosylhydrolase [Candidatus Bipolaricaulota bacterium]
MMGMKKPTAVSLVVSLVVAVGGVALVPAQAQRDFASIQGDQFLVNEQILKVKGCNYQPRDHSWRMFAEWDPTEVDYELGLAEGLNVNVVRICIHYQVFTQNLNYERLIDVAIEPNPEFLGKLDEFLDLAEKHHLKVIITLFDQVYWELYSPRNYWIGDRHLKNIIPRYANDPRILGWDVKNEPDLDFKACGETNVLQFLEHMTKTIRSMDNNHLVTVGLRDYHNIPKVEAFVDFVCFHYYEPEHQLSNVISQIQAETGKPILIEEFGLHTWPYRLGDPHNERDQANYYRVVLNTMKRKGIAGGLFWCLLDYPIGSIPWLPEESFENHMGVFRTDYSEKPAAKVVRWFHF